MARSKDAQFFRDSVFRFGVEPQSDQEDAESCVPTNKVFFSLADDDLDWLDAHCWTMRRKGWRSVTHSTLIRALIRAADHSSVPLDEVTNEDELVDALRQAVKESVTDGPDDPADASILAYPKDVTVNDMGHDRIKLTPRFLSIAFGVILLILSGVSGFYILRGVSGKVDSVQPMIMEVLKEVASPSTVSDSATPLPKATPATLIHVVKSGETLSQIARDYDVSVKALLNANNIDDANLLVIGDKLTIPSK